MTSGTAPDVLATSAGLVQHALSNPVQSWSGGRLALTIGLFAAAFVLAGAMIYVSDGPLRDNGLPASSKLEWVFTPASNAEIVAKYAAADAIGDVVRGMALDTFFFIPAYVGLLALLSFSAARAAPAPWGSIAAVLGWGVFAAGGLDLIENTGIVAAVVLRWSFVAPVTATAAYIKWSLALLAALYAVVALFAVWLSACMSTPR